MKATKRDLIGRRIVAVDFRRFKCDSQSCSCSRRNVTHSAPVLTLDNGRRLFFATDETEIGEYGTDICISEPEPRYPADAEAAGRAEYFRVTGQKDPHV